MNLKMKEIQIGMRFEDERSGKIFTVVEKNSKSKTVMLEAEGENAFSTGLATLNKHYVEVVDLEEMSIPLTEEEIEAENKAFAEKEAEIEVEKVKTKTERKPRKKTDKTNLFDLLPLEEMLVSCKQLNMESSKGLTFSIVRDEDANIFKIVADSIELDKTDYDVSVEGEMDALITKIKELAN